MSDSSNLDIYHSPPQTPQPFEDNVDSDHDLLDSNATSRQSDPRPPVIHPSTEHLFPSTIHLDNTTNMSTVNNSLQDTSSVPFIPNLSDDNWGTWYLAMESYFLIMDLDGVLDKTEPAPPISDTASTRTFLKRKKQVAGIIGLKLSDPIRELIVTDVNQRDPVALWKDIISHLASTKPGTAVVFSQNSSLSLA